MVLLNDEALGRNIKLNCNLFGHQKFIFKDLLVLLPFRDLQACGILLSSLAETSCKCRLGMLEVRCIFVMKGRLR